MGRHVTSAAIAAAVATVAVGAGGKVPSSGKDRRGAAPDTAVTHGESWRVGGARPLPRPLRGWAFAYNITAPANASTALPTSYLYPTGTVNFVPTGAGRDAGAVANLTARGVTVLSWAYCWDSPWVPHTKGGAIANATAAAAYFEVQASPGADGLGRGLDECNLGNAKFAGEREAAAAGFRAARSSGRATVVAAWGANAGDELFALLMRDGTFDLAMVEGYTYCPGCGDWPASGACCATSGSVDAYFGRLDFARAAGFLNRTLFCFGYLLGRSAVNPRGWTPESLRDEMAKVKARYPDLAGVIMYGQAPRRGFPNATNHSTAATDAATFELIRAANELMLSMYPDQNAASLVRA